MIRVKETRRESSAGGLMKLAQNATVGLSPARQKIIYYN